MTSSAKITNILNGTILSVQNILPFKLNIEKPKLFTQPFFQHSIGVLIGITGEISGRILIEGDDDVFSKIGEKMYGIPLEGDLLESFAGELGNMIGGHLATNLSHHQLSMDITPPTVFVGQTKIYGFNQAFCLPIQCEDAGDIQLILMLEEK